MVADVAGYSGKPLAQKLGLRPSYRYRFVHAPDEFADWIGPMPDGAVEADDVLDFAILFVTSAKALRDEMGPLAARVTPAGMIWVAWPKRASKVATDLTEDVVRAVALENRLVDVKVCAVSEVWSGLKLVRRLRDR